jgi:hypothetical protein
MCQLKPRAQRFQVTIPMKYRITGASEWLGGMTVNMSGTGILFQTDEQIPLRSLLEMRLDFPMMSRFYCRASVVRADDPATLVAVKIQNYNLRRQHS